MVFCFSRFHVEGIVFYFMYSFKIAKVAVSEISYFADTLYSYAVPESFDYLKVGQVVLVPFGNSFKDRVGVVYEIERFEESIGQKVNLKSISDVLYKDFLVSEENLNLSKFLRERCFCTLFDALKTMIPFVKGSKSLCFFYTICEDLKKKIDLSTLEKGLKSIVDYLKKKPKGVTLNTLKKIFKEDFDVNIKYLLKNGIILKKIKDEEETFFETGNIEIKRILSEKELKKLTKNQQAVYKLVKEKRNIPFKEVLYFAGVSINTVRSLVKKEIISVFEKTDSLLSFSEKKLVNQKEIILNAEQEVAFKSIYSLYKEKKFNISLLFGITGSGKTSVYIKLIDEAFKQNKGVIVLLPEIALTSQAISNFYLRYGEKVAVYHSALKEKEKIEQYRKVESGKCSILVGTRSAIFLPMKNLSIIIMDEEQEDSYKSESTPRYSAKDIAKYKCYFNNCLLLLCSATPSLESFYLAKSGKYNLQILKKRYGKASLPEVKIVDMSKELKNGNITLFSSYLLEKLKNNLKNNKQSILLINRRGCNTFLVCRNCGSILFCPRCSISLVYHSKNRKLVCHRCYYSTTNINSCPRCNSAEIKFSGSGTQRIEEDLKKLLPDAKILRMDSDVTFTKEVYETKLENFREKKYNIMIGTQMVAKGLDFKDVTLAAILSADQSLYSSDYRGFERSFSLFTQVIGRSGRSESKGEAIIQTFTPENPVVKLSSKQDYEKFFRTEIKLREILKYPPFVKICLVVFKGKNENKVKNIAFSFFGFLKHLILEKYKELALQALSPSEANIFKVKDNYRYKIVIKYKNKKLFYSFLKEALKTFYKEGNTSGVSIFCDVEPNNII